MQLLKCTNFSVRSQIFNALTFEVNPGECHQLVGSNGAGKSSCLRAFAGLIPHTGNLQTIALSFMGHNLGLYEDLTTFEIIDWWQTLTGNEIVRHDFKEQVIRELSAGQKQKLAWLRLINENNKLWLLDEAICNMDDVARNSVMQNIRQHLDNQGSIIFTSHMPEYWQNIITTRHLIHKNTI